MTLFSSKLRFSALKSYVLIIVLALCIIPSSGFAQRDKYAKEIRVIEDAVQKELERLKIPFFIGNSFLGLLQILHNFPKFPPADILE
jgi:hypothetical protein